MSGEFFFEKENYDDQYYIQLSILSTICCARSWYVQSDFCKYKHIVDYSWQ